MNEIVKKLPPFLSGDELVRKLTVIPEYKTEAKEINERLIALLDIYKIYIPTKDTIDIYNRIYSSVLCSLEKKGTMSETKLLNDNFLAIKGLKRYGIIGGLDSFKITGNAGIGKTSAVQRCCDVITNNKIITIDHPYREVIPVLEIETVSDCSIKNLLYTILIKVDETIGTKYFLSNNSQQATTDILLHVVSNVLTNHVGLLCIDEIERVVENKKGSVLMNSLTQLINQSNISICFVGTESSIQFFEREEYFARRTLGISLKKMTYGEYFYNFCSILFRYQYTLNKVDFNSEYSRWLFNRSNGLPSMLISLFVEAQRRAILSGVEKLSIQVLEETYNDVFRTMNDYIEIKEKRSKTSEKTSSVELENICSNINDSFFVNVLKNSNKDINKALQLIRLKVSVESI